ncbi:MAG TPA: HAD family phosphatase [Candidatus Saccharimonadales bacterium]|nr:HAD family phosphatase [Candidatus Saccharimonadales bacterium]
MSKQKFAVFDIDGTLVRWQLYHAMVDRLAKAGFVPQDAYERAMKARLKWKERSGEGAFNAYELELIDAFEATLPGLPVSEFQKAAEAVFAAHKNQVYIYSRDLIHDLKSKNYLIFAISASPYEVVKMVADYYDFDDCVGTIYGQKDGKYTGTLSKIHSRKAEMLEQLIAKHGVIINDSVGAGDSDSDISMLDMVEHPIAYNPTRKLFLYAQAAGWKIVIERKNMVYELVPDSGSYKLELPKT